MTTRSDRSAHRHEFTTLQRQADHTRTRQQLRERAAILARHGNSDTQIACELGLSTDLVSRWLAEAVR